MFYTRCYVALIIMNNKYKITIEAPLVRAGVKIETECSEKYVVKVMEKIMELVREMNAPKPNAT
jgi:hypothetical protein